MANNLSSNYGKKVMPIFLKMFENKRVLSKSVDTQLLSGRIKSDTGASVYFKRPHRFRTIETSGGDISAETKNSIQSGQAAGTVQNMITVPIEWSVLEEAIELNQLEEILAPAVDEMLTTLELNLGRFMYKNLGASYGTPGEAIATWGELAKVGKFAQTLGVHSELYCAISPFTEGELADVQTGLSAGPDSFVGTAFEDATIRKNFAGMRVLSTDVLPTYTSGTLSAGANRAGAINGTPTATYVAHKDTMIQSIPVDGFGAGSDTIKAGEIVEITGKYNLSLSTREQIVGADGNPIKFRGVVTADVTLSSGAGTLLVAGPAISESDGQYNTISAALANDDVITIINPAASTVYQPNLWYAKQAIGLGSVAIPKLHSTDTRGYTRDGMSIRVSRYSDGDANTQTVRFDLLPAFACFNPFMGGQAFGVA